MIRANLSTRPFYNERAVQLWLLVLVLVVAAATVFNVARVIRYSRTDTELATQASRDEARAGDLRAEAARLRGSVDLKEIELASTEARQANALIDRRTFSWTELFNRFETTLPDDVRIASVRPRLDHDRGILLNISVLARTIDDIDTFIRNLEATGAFANVRPVEEHTDEAGLLMSSLEVVYLPGAGKPVVHRGVSR